MNVRTLSAGILWGFGIVAVQGQPQSSCPLSAAKGGDAITLRGEVFPTGHDTFVRPAGCDERVIIVFGDDPTLGKSRVPVKKDEAFREYREYVTAEQAPVDRVVCKQCWKYRVTARFQGRLDVAPSAGWKTDPRSGRVTGIEGFGHPLPFTRYRLVVASVSNVEAVERVPTPPEEHEAQQATPAEERRP